MEWWPEICESEATFRPAPGYGEPGERTSGLPELCRSSSHRLPKAALPRKVTTRPSATHRTSRHYPEILLPLRLRRMRRRPALQDRTPGLS